MADIIAGEIDNYFFYFDPATATYGLTVPKTQPGQVVGIIVRFWNTGNVWQNMRLDCYIKSTGVTLQGDVINDIAPGRVDPGSKRYEECKFPCNSLGDCKVNLILFAEKSFFQPA